MFDHETNNLVHRANECRILPYISDVPLAKMKAAMAAQAAPVEPEAVSKPTQGGPAMPSPENLPSTSWIADAGIRESSGIHRVAATVFFELYNTTVVD